MARLDTIDFKIAVDTLMASQEGTPGSPVVSETVVVFDRFKIEATRDSNGWLLVGGLTLVDTNANSEASAPITRGLAKFNRFLTTYLGERDIKDDRVSITLSAFGAGEPTITALV